MTLPIPQPNTEYYPSSALNLFTERQRGPGDAAFNPQRRRKYWVDTSQVNAPDPTAFVQYLGLHEMPDGSYVQAPFYMTAAEAATFNFPDELPPNVAQPNPTPNTPAWPVPQRALLPNEELKPGALPGTAPVVHRTDLSNAAATFTVADKTAIMQACAKINGA